MAKKIFKEHPIKILLASVCILLFIGITLWNSYAPLPIQDWNRKELSRINVADPNDLTFAVFGDNKGNESIFEPLLRDVDHDMEIAFAIDCGDLVQKGKVGLYRRFLKQVQENLAIPLLTVIGNHDLNGGSATYRKIFGPTYYSFQVGQSYVIVLDATTESGFDKAERQWLEEELRRAQASAARFVFMHVPVFDPRGGKYHKSLPEKDQKDLLNLFRRYKVTQLFASHIHGWFSGVWEDVPYTIAGGAGARLQGSDPQHFFHHYVKVHVHNGEAQMTVIRIDGEDGIVYYFDLMEDYILEWGLLLGAGICLFTLALSLRNKRHS
jgi:3',5'-cyclic AMP phosphodiesterase CpdA